MEAVQQEEEEPHEQQDIDIEDATLQTIQVSSNAIPVG